MKNFFIGMIAEAVATLLVFLFLYMNFYFIKGNIYEQS
jgi:hypothetical protein